MSEESRMIGLVGSIIGGIVCLLLAITSGSSALVVLVVFGYGVFLGGISFGIGEPVWMLGILLSITLGYLFGRILLFDGPYLLEPIKVCLHAPVCVIGPLMQVVLYVFGGCLVSSMVLGTLSYVSSN